MKFVWEKPVITFYLEKFEKPKTEAFLVVKARRLTITKKEKSNKLRCTLEDFFPLMGNIDYLSSEEGKVDKYVLCWFDDRQSDLNKSFRRLIEVTFPEGIRSINDENDKMSFNADFEAKLGKLE